MNKKNNKKGLLIFLTIIASLVALFGYFYIPLLTIIGVAFPSKDILWVLSIIPTIFTFQIPLILCIMALREK